MRPEELEREGYLVTAGLIDLHAHLREPGFEDSETIATGAHAALRGGFTTICAMPNTEPAIDSPGLVAELTLRGEAAGGARVLPIATITRGRAGHELADLIELAAAGAVAFSDDGSPVDDARLFRHALEYARAKDLLVIEHPQDMALSAKGVMHEGVVSARLGLSGIPSAAEEAAVARDLELAELTGARLHLTHLSTAGSVALVRAAKADGIRVTCDVTPHHLALIDEWVAGSRALAWEDAPGVRAVPYDSSTKVNPPLRTLADVRALWKGLADGTVDAIATDHAPHASPKKDVEFDQAAFGISGIETALSLVLGGLVRARRRDPRAHQRPRRDPRPHGARGRLDRDRSGRRVDRDRRRARLARKEHPAPRKDAAWSRRRSRRGWGSAVRRRDAWRDAGSRSLSGCWPRRSCIFMHRKRIVMHL